MRGVHHDDDHASRESAMYTCNDFSKPKVSDAANCLLYVRRCDDATIMAIRHGSLSFAITLLSPTAS